MTPATLTAAEVLTIVGTAGTCIYCHPEQNRKGVIGPGNQGHAVTTGNGAADKPAPDSTQLKLSL
jgi:hypothetical protein